MREFFFKFKFICLTFFASISVLLIILLFRQKLVSDDAFKMTYPEVVFVNKVSIDKDVAVSSLRDLITPFLEQEKLLEVDIRTLSSQIEELAWVENVAVIRDFPNVLKIMIKSKNVIGYKAFDGNYLPVSENGEVLNFPVDYEGGFLIFGDLSEEKLPDLLNFLKSYPNLLNKTVGAQLINGLRWNLYLYSVDEDGILVKLDNSFYDGIKKLEELDLLQGILSKNISEIDLRDLDKILIKQRGNNGVW